MKRNSKVGCLLSLHTNFTTVLFEAMPDFCKGETMAEVVAGPSGVSSSNWFPANCQNCCVMVIFRDIYWEISSVILIFT